MDQRIEGEPRWSKITKCQNRLVQFFLTQALKDKPQIFKEAMSTPETPFWKEIVNNKTESIL